MRLVDSVAGRITRILLTVPAFAAEHFAGSLASVIAALPEDAELDVLVSPEAEPLTRAWVAARRAPVRLHLAPGDLSFSHWTQDAGIAVEEGGKPTLLISRLFDRAQDAEAARLLAEAAGVGVIATDLALDGGNILPVGDDILIGADTLGLNAGALPGLDAGRVVALGCGVGAHAETVSAAHLPDGWRETRRVGVPEGSAQPLFHIDLFVAPAGGQRVLVGCPRLGAEVLGLPLLDHADADRFDRVAATLTEAGYEVHRNPQPLIWMDDAGARLRTWYHLPVNNVLAEDCGPDHRRVWLPHFAEPPWEALAAIDRANADLWRRLGFEVHPVPGLLALAENRGALRCLCKVVERV